MPHPTDPVDRRTAHMLELPLWVQAIALGVVQGLTEFLPVSSSGHLVIAPYLLGWEQPPLAFGVAVHVGTLVAVLVHFRRDLQGLLAALVGSGSAEDVAVGRRMIAVLAIGSVPAAVLGLTLGETFDRAFGDPRVAAVALFATAGLLVTAERITARRAAAARGVDEEEARGLDVGRPAEDVRPRDAVLIGLAQGLALVPGISRAGATMAAGMVRGLSRTGAARFSFLLSIPVIAGAGVLEAPALVEDGGFGAFSVPQTLLGAVVAGVSGFWAIRFLLRLVAGDDLLGFARYVAVLGVLTLAASVVIGPPAG